jgi:hypothetical protein
MLTWLHQAVPQGAAMMTSRTSTAITATRRVGQPYVAAILGVAGASMLVAGIWAGAAPRSFARFVDFPYDEHFLHDLGAFQIGIGVTLLVALAWRDAVTVALTGFLIANTLHAVSHAIDLDLGGRASDPYAIGALSLLTAAALVVRVRQRRTPMPVPENRPCPSATGPSSSGPGVGGHSFHDT